MRIGPKEIIAGHPSAFVRDVLRRLRAHPEFALEALEGATRLPAAQAKNFIKRMVAAGLVEMVSKGSWSITQAGQTLSSATAAPALRHTTAERALREFLWRVDQVNKQRYYLGKVVAVVLFGSMLKPGVDRVSDVDLAVEIAPKEADRERARIKNWQRANELEEIGRRFRGPLGRDFCWYWEVFEFLKGRGRAISLVDLKHEGEFVLAVPHKWLLCDGQWNSDAPPRVAPRRRYPAISEGDELF